MTRSLLFALVCGAAAFHDCVQPRSAARVPLDAAATAADNCGGGLCLGMHGGPHEGGPAAYAVGDAASGFTSVYSLMTVPALPKKLDGICYYLWSDIYFGHMSLGVRSAAHPLALRFATAHPTHSPAPTFQRAAYESNGPTAHPR